MGRKILSSTPPLAALLLLTFSVCPAPLRAQSQREPPAQPKEIAVTIDDLPLNGPQFDAARLRAMTDKLLSGLSRHRIPAVGFVNEGLLYAVPNEADERLSILRAWADAGMGLGNHTFSHLGFRNASLADYTDDFTRGDAVTRLLLKARGQKPRYFRHPFLQMGPTAEIEKAFQSFIAERGYRAAPITVDTMDWMFLAAYSKARAASDSEMLRRVSDEYIKYAGLRFDFCERVSTEMFGRRIRHILLLHANELNADNFDALVEVMKSRGYQFITLEQALADPVYQFPVKYAPTSDWLSHWAQSKGQKFDPPAPPDFIQKEFAAQQSGR